MEEKGLRAPTLRRMTVSPGQSDPVYSSVDSLVRDGTLMPAQADTVYERVRGAGGATGRIDTDSDRRRWTLPLRGAGGAAVLGAGMLLGAAFVARSLADQPDFNWKAFLVVLISALGLVAVGAAVAILGGEPDHRRWFASGLIATGIVAAALALDIVLRDEDWANYLTGGLMLVAGAAAYFWLRGSALIAVTVLGGLWFIAEAVSDISDDSPDTTPGPGIAVTVYGLVVIAAGWRLGERHVAGMLGGIVALVGMLQVVYIGSLFGPPPMDGDTFGEDADGDIWTALIVGLLVCAVLGALYAYSDYVGYVVLAVLGAAALVPGALLALITDNRLWYAAIVGGVGALLLGAAALRELLSRRGRGGGSVRYGSPPSSSGQYGPGPGGPPSQPQYPPPSYPPASASPPYGAPPQPQ